MEPAKSQQPSAAFIAASWLALFIGIIAFIIGLWNAEMQLNEKGYYFTVLMFGLFSAISVQKAVRDQLEGVPVTNIYYGLSWFCTIYPLYCSQWDSGTLIFKKVKKAFMLWHLC